MSGAIKAQRAEDFVQTIGVNTHIGWTGTIYGNVPIAQQELTYLGVDHVRDQQPNPGSLAADQALAAQGIKFDMYVGGPGNDFAKDLPTLLPNLDTFARSNPGGDLLVGGTE
jgi:trimeric autotransporter adhesin